MSQARVLLGIALCSAQLCSVVAGSDHADPIDPFYLQRQESAITDLYVFPVRKRDPQAEAPANYSQMIANPHQRGELTLHDPLKDIVREELTDEERQNIDAVVFILCVRRQLSDAGSLNFDKHEFRIHIDVDSAINFPEPPGSTGATVPSRGEHNSHGPISAVESFARYGGQITNPDSINEDITISFRLTNQAKLHSDSLQFPNNSGASNWTNERIDAIAGVFDDPFIFPMFFGTNVVGVVIRVPIDLFADNADFLVWATSHHRSRQIDHVGRSLRTQNPRFELLNTLHPREHVRAITAEHTAPSLMRDLKLRLNLASYFAFRRWDFVPDVMCFSTRYPAGFPNGRLLTDDVAAILAQHGDTLLYELSYQDNQGSWPRQSVNDTNDGEFQSEFPYLNPPHENPIPASNRRLTWASVMKLAALGVLFIGFFVLEHWLVARVYCWWKSRRRYL